MPEVIECLDINVLSTSQGHLRTKPNTDGHMINTQNVILFTCILRRAKYCLVIFINKHKNQQHLSISRIQTEIVTKRHQTEVTSNWRMMQAVTANILEFLCSVKGATKQDASWAEKAGYVQMLPTAVFTWLFCQYLCNGSIFLFIFCFKFELRRAQPKLQAMVYDIIPSTTAVFRYAVGSRKLSANEQFFVGAQTVVSLLQTTQIKQGMSFIVANKVYTSTSKNTIVWIETELFFSSFFTRGGCVSCLHACLGARLLLQSY